MSNYHKLHQQAIDWEYDVIEMAQFHPRAWKLLKKHKPFLVVAIDEPYYLMVYHFIKEQEIKNGRWTAEDEQKYLESVKFVVDMENEKEE